MATTTDNHAPATHNTGKEMDLEVVWTIERKPGKHVKLYLKNKEQQFRYKIEREGRYSLAINTPDFLPGGAAGRKVEALVSVYASTAEAPELEPVEELSEYVLRDEAARKNLIIRDTWEVHSKESTTVAEFEVKPEQLPASIHVVAKTHTPLIGMRFAGKLYRNANLSSIHDDSGRSLETMDQWIYESLTLESIEKELSRESEYKERSFEKGFIRPFLLLAAMHPIMRMQIGDLMGIKLLDLAGEEDWSHDPHAQADRLLLKHLKGLGSIADHMYETANPVSSKSNWYECLYRGSTEVHPEDHGKMETKIVKSTDKPCKEVNSKDMHELETQFLLTARKMHLKEIGKLEKDSNVLTQRVDKYMKDAAVIEMLDRMEKNGVDNADVRRFLVEICVAAEYQTWLHYFEMEEKIKPKEERRDLEKEELARMWAEETAKDDKLREDDPYNHAILGGTRSQLMRGNYDPRGLSETGKALAKKAGQMVAKKAFKHFILTPMFPFLVLPYDIANLADKVLGSDHQTVWLVSLQILLQDLLLAAHGIRIEEHYRGLSDQWAKENA